MGYARSMRYPDGGRLTAAKRVRLEAAEMIEAAVPYLSALVYVAKFAQAVF